MGCKQCKCFDSCSSPDTPADSNSIQLLDAATATVGRQQSTCNTSTPTTTCTKHHHHQTKEGCEEETNTFQDDVDSPLMSKTKATSVVHLGGTFDNDSKCDANAEKNTTTTEGLHSVSPQLSPNPLNEFHLQCKEYGGTTDDVFSDDDEQDYELNRSASQWPYISACEADDAEDHSHSGSDPNTASLQAAETELLYSVVSGTTASVTFGSTVLAEDEEDTGSDILAKTVHQKRSNVPWSIPTPGSTLTSSVGESRTVGADSVVSPDEYAWFPPYRCASPEYLILDDGGRDIPLIDLDGNHYNCEVDARIAHDELAWKNEEVLHSSLQGYCFQLSVANECPPPAVAFRHNSRQLIEKYNAAYSGTFSNCGTNSGMIIAHTRPNSTVRLYIPALVGKDGAASVSTVFSSCGSPDDNSVNGEPMVSATYG